MTVAPKTKQFMLWGGVGAGKTTLLRALQQEAGLPVRKTQMVDYAGWGIDTPGEYSEMGHLRRHLVTTATDAQLILVVHDATRPDSQFPPHYFLMFSQPVIGVVTKVDVPGANLNRATMLLRQCGVRGKIFYVSAINGSGLSALRQNLLTYSSHRKE
ncbi:MAG: EutP/PduV family microcompartment system protein [Anaerolineae bacterium]